MLVASLVVVARATPQPAPEPDWSRVREETLRHFQALVRFDTTDPPGGEEPAAAYLREVLEKEGIPVQVFALEPRRPNIVARLTGSGRKRPLLIMGHTDTVNIDPAKWTFPPFSAALDGGYIYGRGTLDDKDNVTAALMSMLLLKRLNVPLDRDVIFLAESGEEGSTRVGIQFMVNQHFSAIDAEYCLAETGSVVRTGGEVKYARIQTLEKVPRAIELIARGAAGHGSVPLRTNSIVRLATTSSRRRRRQRWMSGCCRTRIPRSCSRPFVTSSATRTWRYDGQRSARDARSFRRRVSTRRCFRRSRPA
jgi:acetylornithine deacetylase/succinyl-diaminopimelate desuccinylase-like protein